MCSNCPRRLLFRRRGDASVTTRSSQAPWGEQSCIICRGRAVYGVTVPADEEGLFWMSDLCRLLRRVSIEPIPTHLPLERSAVR